MFKVLIQAYYFFKYIIHFFHLCLLSFYPWQLIAILKMLLSFYNLVQYMFTCVFKCCFYACYFFYPWLQYFRRESDPIWSASFRTVMSLLTDRRSRLSGAVLTWSWTRSKQWRWSWRGLQEPPLPPLTIMNSTVTAVESFLGTTMSQDLKWDNHIEWCILCLCYFVHCVFVYCSFVVCVRSCCCHSVALWSFCHYNKVLLCVNIPNNKAHSDSDKYVTHCTNTIKN